MYYLNCPCFNSLNLKTVIKIMSLSHVCCEASMRYYLHLGNITINEACGRENCQVNVLSAHPRGVAFPYGHC